MFVLQSNPPLPGSRTHFTVEETVKHRYEESLKGLEERVEVDEDDLGDLALSRVHKEQHVGDAQEWQENQSSFNSFPVLDGLRGC